MNKIVIKPTEKDKVITKDSALVVANHIVDEIAKTIPGINIAWGLSKALYGAGMKLRERKALEWVEMVRDNPSIFTEDLWSDEKFQDGFVVAFEKYLTERNEEKRNIFRNIFLGFSKVEDKDKFPLEKFIHTLSQMGEVDVEVLKDVDTNRTGANYQIYGNNSDKIDNIYNLIGLALLLNTTGTRGGIDPNNSPFIKLSIFGGEFIEYLKNE